MSEAVDLRLEMDLVITSCEQLEVAFKLTKQYHQLKAIKEYFIELVESEQVEWWQWAIDKVLHEPIETAYKNLKGFVNSEWERGFDEKAH